MNKLTQNVLTIQGLKNDSYERDLLFTDIYNDVKRTINQVTSQYTYSLRGDAASIESVALEVLLDCVSTFTYEGYEFLTFFKKSLHNRVIDLIRHNSSAKVKHNVDYDLPISASKEDEKGEYSTIEYLAVEGLVTKDTYELEESLTLQTILDRFSMDKPKESGAIELMFKYSGEGYSKKDLTDALTKYYEGTKYAGAVQRKVSRAREAFKNYAINLGYKLSF